MAFSKQRRTARGNIKKAAKTARKKRTGAHLPKRTRTALGKEGVPRRQRRRNARFTRSNAQERWPIYVSRMISGVIVANILASSAETLSWITKAITASINVTTAKIPSATKALLA